MSKNYSNKNHSGNKTTSDNTVAKDSKVKDSRNYKGKSGSGNKSNSTYHKGTDYNYSDKQRANDSGAVSANRVPYDAIHSNDINWWNKSPMYKDVVRVPFNRIYGNGFTTRYVNVPAYVTLGYPKDVKQPLGSVLTIDYVPSIGTSKDGNSAVNRAFNSLFGELYSRTTGTPPIQQMDVAMFITSLCSCATYIGAMKRALGVSKLYSSVNYTYPQVLLRALGFKPDTVIGHQDELRYALNDCILNFNNLKVPDVMDIYARQYALAHNLYIDEDDTQAQIYAFRPAGYYIYEDTANPAKLKFIQASYDTNGQNAVAVINAINEMLEAWRNSSDLALISGTIQRAFTDTQSVTLDYVIESDAVLPTVDRNIMWQINNLNMFRPNWQSLDITQDPVKNILLFKPELDSNYLTDIVSVAQLDYVLNSFDGNTSDEFIMEATRLISFTDPGDESNLIVPTEFVTAMQLWYADTDVITNKPTVSVTNLSTQYAFNGAVTVPSILSFIKAMSIASQYKYHPRMSLFYSSASEPDAAHPYIYQGSFGDLYKFTTIDTSALYGLYKAATQSVYKTYIKGSLGAK